MSWPPQTFLGMLSEASRRELLSLGTTREYLLDSVLILEGDSSTHVMVLIDGWVKVVGSTEGGGQALLSLRVGGDLVGELAALDDAPRSATVISAGVSTVQVVSQRDFLQLMGQHPDVGVAVSRALTSELRWATRRRVDFSGLPVIARLARVLSELGYLYGKQTPDGIEFQYTLTQPELAAMVGASEPSVHKALRQLRQDGAVSTGYRQVVITNPAALDAIASSRSGLRCRPGKRVPGNPLNNGVKCAATRHREHMDDKPHGIRRLCVAFGIDPPSGYGNHEKAAAERLGVTAFTEVCAALGLNRMLLDRHDSGQVGLLPVGIDEPMVVSSLIEALASALAGRSVRFRLAFHEGITILTADGFGGKAVAKVRRLAESPPLRAALTEHPAASLAAILSAPVFEDIVFEDIGPGLHADQFRQVEVADPERASRDIAWIFVPVPRLG